MYSSHTAVDVPDLPFGHHLGIVEHVEPPRAQPVDRPEQHVEGIAGQEALHLVHPPLVVVDLETEDHRIALLLDRLDHFDIGVEVHPAWWSQ